MKNKAFVDFTDLSLLLFSSSTLNFLEKLVPQLVEYKKEGS